MKNSIRVPSFAEEKRLEAQGYQRTAGIDEVGRGPLAGPVVAAAVILPRGINAPWLDMVRDSKQLSPPRREFLFNHIREVAVGVGIGMARSEKVDIMGIVRATQLAMKQAVEWLSPLPDSLLIDYMSLPELKLPQKGITKGDSLCISIACASIVAKVTRDRLMMEYDGIFPGYGFAAHKGYATREHLACLRRLGPSPIHRRSFQPVKDVLGK